MQMIPEPFKIKMVEAIRLISKEERKAALKRAFYNPFALKSDEIFIDLLTDSGTGAMSDSQWAGLIKGDESYAGSRSFFHLKDIAIKTFGYSHVIPVHQGRGAEHILFKSLIQPGQYVLGNMHFDTTKAHIKQCGGIPRDFLTDAAFETDIFHPFKGNIDLKKLSDFIEEKGKEQIAFILITITCNSAGGQPVSLENLQAAYHLAKKNHLRIFIDAARFAENAYFIKTREEAYQNASIAEIVAETFRYADGCTVSAKKDSLVNIGGLCCLNDDPQLLKTIESYCVLYEGFLTYGGLAGRDLEGLAQGLLEAVDGEYLHYRISQVAYLGEKLRQLDIPIQYPTGGHAVFVDAKKMLPHIPSSQFPAQSLANALYLEAGIRGVEVGSLLFGPDENEPSSFEFLRLTIPRRTYTYAHLDYVAQAFKHIKHHAKSLSGLNLVEEPKILRHFMAKLEPVLQER